MSEFKGAVHVAAILAALPKKASDNDAWLVCRTHATYYSIVRPKGETIEYNSLRRMVAKLEANVFSPPAKQVVFCFSRLRSLNSLKWATKEVIQLCMTSYLFYNFNKYVSAEITCTIPFNLWGNFDNGRKIHQSSIVGFFLVNILRIYL